jgi:hypothetical protein
MIKWIAALMVLAPFLVSCEKTDLTPPDKYETLPSPPLGEGDCEYKKLGLGQELAESERVRLAGIFSNATLGSYSVPVRSSEVFPYKTKNGVPYQWGMHIVFGCNGAEIKFEEVAGFNSEQQRDQAYKARLELINQGRLTKLLDTRKDYWSWEDCDTCSEEVCDTCTDEDGYDYDCNCHTEEYDCNCSTDYEYYFQVTYAKVNPNNLRQAAFIQNYEVFSATLAAKNNGVRPGLTDSLSAARKQLPSFTDSAKNVRDWQSLILKTRTPAPKSKAKRACPAKKTGKIIRFLKANKSQMKLGRKKP